MKIKRNEIECAHCRARIVSAHRHDFKAHNCAALDGRYGKDGYIAVDGGTSYLRRIGDPQDWIERSIMEDATAEGPAA